MGQTQVVHRDTAAQRISRLVRQASHRASTGRRSSPAILRAGLAVTVVLAALFAVLGAYGINRRDSAIEDVRDSATQLLALQDIRVAVVRADAVASSSYLVGGAEDPAQRTAYLDQIRSASARLIDVALNLDLDEADATALGAAGRQLADYVGLVEQARANNRQGFPVGAAYQRQANSVVTTQVVPSLRKVEEHQRQRVNDQLDSAHWAGVWFVATGVLTLLALVVGGLWMAARFKRLVNVPVALAVVVLLALLIGGGTRQAAAVRDGDAAVSGGLAVADLVSQARAAGYDAVSQEALTLINRGSGQANELAWQQSAGTAGDALRQACSIDPAVCSLGDQFQSYVTGHEQVRTLDEGGDWEQAVAISLGDEQVDVGGVQLNVPDVFDGFAQASDEVVAADTSTARRVLDDATSSLELLRWLTIVAGVVIAGLAATGYGQRLREYR